MQGLSWGKKLSQLKIFKWALIESLLCARCFPIHQQILSLHQTFPWLLIIQNDTQVFSIIYKGSHNLGLSTTLVSSPNTDHNPHFTFLSSRKSALTHSHPLAGLKALLLQFYSSSDCSIFHTTLPWSVYLSVSSSDCELFKGRNITQFQAKQ